MDRGSMTEAEAAESMCRRLPQRLHETAHLLVDRWDRPILPVAGMEQLVSDLKKAGYGVYLLSNASYRQHEYWPGGFPEVSILTGRLFPPTSSWSNRKQRFTVCCTKRSSLSPRNVCLSTTPPRISKARNAPVCRDRLPRRRGRASRKWQAFGVQIP